MDSCGFIPPDTPYHRFPNRLPFRFNLVDIQAGEAFLLSFQEWL